MRCETCKHWDRTYDLTFDNVTAHVCNKIGMKNWRNNNDEEIPGDVYDPSLPVEHVYVKDEEGKVVEYKEKLHGLAYVVDASDYRAELHTHPYFGCCLWEEKK